jgi:3-phenylpropionate/trans-cinnamate dioxygenase ferredoxin reductase subunit
MTNGRFSVWWLQDAKLKAAFVMNRPDEERELAPQWIESGVDISTARLTNVEQPLTAATENVAA